VTHDEQYVRLHFRILVEAGCSTCRGPVEHLLHGGGTAAVPARIGDAEHIDHEVRDPRGAIPFVVCAVPLLGGAAQLDSLQDRKGGQQQQGTRGHRDTDAVPPQVLSQSVGGGVGARRYRLVRQVAAQVRGQLARGRIAACALALERFHRDPVEVSAQRAYQLVYLGAAGLGFRGRGVTLRCQFCAWHGRLILADAA